MLSICRKEQCSLSYLKADNFKLLKYEIAVCVHVDDFHFHQCYENLNLFKLRKRSKKVDLEFSPKNYVREKYLKK